MIVTRTKSAFDTQAFAAALAAAVQPRDLILLSGTMGAGKTTFTKGFGEALMVTEPITSPTFVLMHTYEGTLPLHHVDIYRVGHMQEVIDLGLMELLDEGGVALVEWGELAQPVLPRDFLELRFATDDEDDDVRIIELHFIGEQWERREADIAPYVTQWITDGGLQ